MQVEKVEYGWVRGQVPDAGSFVRLKGGRGFNSLKREAIRRRRYANTMVVSSLIGVAGLVMLFAALLR